MRKRRIKKNDLSYPENECPPPCKTTCHVERKNRYIAGSYAQAKSILLTWSLYFNLKLPRP